MSSGQSDISRIDWATAILNSGKPSQNFEKLALANKKFYNLANFKILAIFKSASSSITRPGKKKKKYANM